MVMVECPSLKNLKWDLFPIYITRDTPHPMEQFYRKKHAVSTSKDFSFQAIEWWPHDEDASGSDNSSDGGDAKAYVIRVFGATEDGRSVQLRINKFTPFYFIKVGDDFGKRKLRAFIEFVKKKWCLVEDKCDIIERKDIWGFSNGATFKFVRLVFQSYEAFSRSKYLFMKAVAIPGVSTSPVKYKLYESNFDPFMRFAHLRDIRTAGWIKLAAGTFKRTKHESTCQIELEADWQAVHNHNERKDMANFLQASWDIEVYSFDGTFPEAKKLPNKIIQIATTYKYYSSDNIFAKHLLTLKNCDPIDDKDTYVETFDDEKSLIMRWIDVITKLDADIFYTYNGDTFDCMYLYERCRLLGITDYFTSGMSRLYSTPSLIKKEYFSSSAYGDNEYNRLYIPGRLNYDLMIHMKRGMKKYPSYKLDYIAKEILKEGKNDLPAKEIFSYFAIGTPDKIKTIGEYCIQDTVLLQRIVDKQLILINIVQLANVTCVPISFLTTRGQTIKVYSQILRKAREMGYLVPHTNFNEDSFPVFITTKTEHGFDEGHVGRYVDLSCGSLWGKYKIDNVKNEKTLCVRVDKEIETPLRGTLIGPTGKLSVTRLVSAEEEEADSFTGATVLEPHPGSYFDDIAVEDFASLYPTIMMAYNLCYSAFVMDEKYLGIPGVKYETIEWDDQVEYKLRQTCNGIGKTGKRKGEECGKPAFFEVDGKFFCRVHDPIKKQRTEETKVMKRPVHYKYTVVQPSKDADGNVVNRGVVPSLLDELYTERKKVKRWMNEAADKGDKRLEDIYNAQQLAIKVSLNSTYGFLGRSRGNLVWKPLASIVTYTGRKMILQSKEYAENAFIDFVRKEKLLTAELTYTKSGLNQRQRLEALERFRVT